MKIEILNVQETTTNADTCVRFMIFTKAAEQSALCLVLAHTESSNGQENTVNKTNWLLITNLFLRWFLTWIVLLFLSIIIKFYWYSLPLLCFCKEHCAEGPRLLLAHTGSSNGRGNTVNWTNWLLITTAFLRWFSPKCKCQNDR